MVWDAGQSECLSEGQKEELSVGLRWEETKHEQGLGGTWPEAGFEGLTGQTKILGAGEL